VVASAGPAQLREGLDAAGPACHNPADPQHKGKEAAMLKMHEVVGTSPQSFAEAVKAAVNRLMAAGEKVHFFTVSELRGAVRDGKIECQAVVKVAVES